MGRKSTAQPRPVLTVPPRGIGPVVEPNENDVLCGRGGRINSHTGNIHFRDVINARKKEYLAPTTKKLEKAHIAAAIVNDIRRMNPPGRFLKEERDTGLWFDIGDAKAIKKTGQALREDAPDFRQELEEDSSGRDDKSPKKGEKSTSPKEDKKPESKPEKTVSKSPPKEKATSPRRRVPKAHQQRSTMSGRGGPQQTLSNPGAWPQGNGDHMTPQDYQAQVAMPPPFPHQVNPYLDQSQQVPAMMQNQNTFGMLSIPIQAPKMPGIYSLPNQLYSGARSVGQKVASMSKQAVDTLSRSGRIQPNQRDPNERPPEAVAFGLPFHAPTVLSSNNTMSTISGLSDPLSSGMGMDGGSGLRSSRGRPGGSRPARRPNLRNESLRLSQLVGFSNRQPSRSQCTSSRLSELTDPMERQGMQSSRMSDLTPTSIRSLGSGMGSISFPRSNSFPDMSSVIERDTWQAIMEGFEEDLFTGSQQGRSVLSGGSSGRFSNGSGLGRMGGVARGSSVMSIATLSTASYNQWLAGMRDSRPDSHMMDDDRSILDDGRSILSEMSSDLNALDLASPRL
jgi:hypothetical protein